MSKPPFSGPREEAVYWKTRYYSLEKELKETRITLDEYQTSSKELEEELERELHILEEQNKKLKVQNQCLTFELDALAQKQKAISLESSRNISSLQKELEMLQEGYEKMQRRTVNLEMDNEELESYKRMTHCSMVDMMEKFKEAREWEGKFEQETKKSNLMKEEIQRLKDELRDLENELSVTRSNALVSPALSPTPSNSPPSPTPCRNLCDNPDHTAFDLHSHSSTPPSPLPTAHQFTEYQRKGGSPMDTIQEIMLRVKTLENRLISCRSIVSPLLPSFRDNSDSMIEPPSPPSDFNHRPGKALNRQ